MWGIVGGSRLAGQVFPPWSRSTHTHHAYSDRPQPFDVGGSCKGADQGFVIEEAILTSGDCTLRFKTNSDFSECSRLKVRTRGELFERNVEEQSGNCGIIICKHNGDIK